MTMVISSILKLLRYLLVMWILPYLIGARLGHFTEGDEPRTMNRIFSGYIMMWAVMQLIAVPMIFLHISFHTFVLVCCAIFAVIAIANVVRERTDIVSEMKNLPRHLKEDGFLRILLYILIFGQALYVALSYLSNDDDAFYVASAQTSIDTDTMYAIDPYTGDLFKRLPSRYVLSPFPLFVAFMSKMMGVKAPVMAHTLLPFLLIIFVYVVYFMWAKLLFADNKKAQVMFMFFVMLVLAYSNFTTHARGMMMFPRIWQGKAVLATILLPYILLLGMRMISIEIKRMEWINLFIVMMASCFVTSMGIMLAAIEIGICGFLAILRHKNLKYLLYTIICCLPNLTYAAIYIFIK